MILETGVTHLSGGGHMPEAGVVTQAQLCLPITLTAATARYRTAIVRVFGFVTLNVLHVIDITRR